MKIDDGTGSGACLKIDSNNRAHTQSISETEQLHAAELGDAYNLNSGNISLSTSGTLVYLKNNEDKDLVVQNIAIGLGSATVSDSPEITVERNPNGGDLISDATAVSMNANRNFGSNKTLTADVFKGKSGGTSTGGDDIVIFYQSAGSRLFASIDLILPKGSSIAITIDPKLSSGTVKAYCAIVCFLKDPAGKDV